MLIYVNNKTVNIIFKKERKKKNIKKINIL